ncbi:peptidase M18 [Cladochytrium replicatum]|nr:peptidase M18 [Cladochytrium replicatum]
MSATDFLDFVDASPSPFHAVEESRKRLLSAGFTELRERDSWSLVPGGKYFFTRNKSSITAFAVGGKYAHGNGFSIVGAHTDSPCLKVKPRSKKEKSGYLQVGVELYGGGLWNTWFDRDLGIAGRVVIQNGDKFEHRLVRIDEPILRIPTLAIHLDRTVISDGFKFNTEVHLTPILCSSAKAGLTGDVPKTEGAEEKHQPLLLKALAKELSVNALEIGDFELCLFDTQPSRIGGLLNEYIFSPRLDNLNSSYCALTGLINAGDLENDTKVRMVSLFDNEEVGSVSAYGADSDLLLKAIRRIQEEVAAPGSAKASFERALAQSYLISADMAHAVHPNYAEKFEENHRPQMNKGVVIKQNANQRYATTAVTTFLLREVAKVRNVPLQEFVVRNDSPCGSTIGPMLSAKLGIRTIDVGNPQLSMHSIRETCGTDDVKHATDLFQSFFEHFHTIDAKLSVD